MAFSPNRRKSPPRRARIIQPAHPLATIDKEWPALNRGGRFLFSRKFTDANDLHSVRRREQHTGNQSGANKGRERFAIDNAQADRTEARIEIAAVYTSQTLFLRHRAREIAARRHGLIDHPQCAGLHGKQCEINRRTLIRLRVFQDKMPMYDTGTSRLRIRRKNCPLRMRSGRDSEKKERGPTLYHRISAVAPENADRFATDPKSDLLSGLAPLRHWAGLTTGPGFQSRDRCRQEWRKLLPRQP